MRAAMRFWLAVAFLAGLSTTACGGGGDGPGVDTTTGTDVAGDSADVVAGDLPADDAPPRPDVVQDVSADDPATPDAEHDVPAGDVPADRPGADDAPAPACVDGQACDDGDPCTFDDRCTDGECAGTAVEACDDEVDCTDDACSAADACTHEVKPGWCLVDGACYEEGDVDPQHACMGCVSALAQDRFLPDDGLPCSDGDGCTTGDRCRSGECVPGPVGCDDGDPCTSDECLDGDCVNSALTGTPCDDGDWCTTGDHCVSGSCQGTTVDCDDGDGCTQDSCGEDGTCGHTPKDVACDDGNACTVGDWCVAGTCVPGTDRLDCDDHDVCTDDGCVPDKAGGCVHIPNRAPCDDGDPCTVGDTCRKGTCEAGIDPLPCDDGKLCTNDVCTKGVGCEYPPNTDPCDDGDPCTVGDTCGGGECQHGSGGLDCDDEDVCTTDSCQEGVGCQHVYNSEPCDDGTVCTIDDVCSAVDGTCAGTAISCDDDQQCTSDSCNAVEGCQHKVLNRPECRPQIVIDFPPRGATLDAASAKAGTTRTIQVQGHVYTGLDGWQVPSLSVNGFPLLPDPVDRSFTFDIDSVQGMNPIVVDAQDEMGLKDHVVQSYYYSTQWYDVDQANPAQSMVDEGLMMFLGPKVWDDGNRNPPVNDIADIIKAYLAGMDLMSMISNPMATGSSTGCKYSVNVNSITFNKTNIGISLTPVEGGLALAASLHDIVVAFRANMSNDPICLLGSFNGTMSISWVNLSTKMLLSVDASGQPVATMANTVVTMADPELSTSNWLVNLLKGLFTSTLKDALIDGFSDAIGSLGDSLEDALAGLAINTDFEIPAFVEGGTPTTLGMRTKLQMIACHPSGCTIGMKATIVAPNGLVHDVKGSIGRAACLTGVVEPVPTYPAGSSTPTVPSIELGLHDDFFNQIPYALFLAGGLTMDVPASMLSGVDLSAYGITDLAVGLDMWLPPILSACNAQNSLSIQIGDLGIHATMKLFGSPVDMQLFASVAADASLTTVDTADGKELSISLGDPKFLDVEIASLSGGLVGAEETLGNLIRTVLIPQLLTSLTGDALGSFPIPSLDLSGMMEGLPPGTSISIDIREILRRNAYNVVSGTVK